MTPGELKLRKPDREFTFATSRSGGPGGQNVNKVSTRVELRFNLGKSAIFSDDEKKLIHDFLGNRINLADELVLVSQDERTQLANKTAVIEKFYMLVSRALTLKPERKESQPSRASKVKRINDKKAHSLIKKARRKIQGKDE